MSRNRQARARACRNAQILTFSSVGDCALTASDLEDAGTLHTLFDSRELRDPVKLPFSIVGARCATVQGFAVSMAVKVIVAELRSLSLAMCLCIGDLDAV